MKPLDSRYILCGHTPVEIDDLLVWAKSMNTVQRVAETNIGEVYISTVFLGIDHQFGQGEPLLFETMIFGGHFDGEMKRYHTWDEAEAGHNEMVERVKLEQQ